MRRELDDSERVYNKLSVSQERFRKIWNESDTSVEVAKRVGVDRSYCRILACRMRKRGFMLKMMSKGRRATRSK